MPYVNVRVPTSFDGDRWVRAFEVIPTAPEVVHHVLVFALSPAEDGGLRPVHPEATGFFAAWVPGAEPRVYGDGYAKRLPKGATLHFQLHYTPNGRPAVDRTRLHLRFADGPPEHEVKRRAADQTPQVGDGTGPSACPDGANGSFVQGNVSSGNFQAAMNAKMAANTAWLQSWKLNATSTAQP